MVNALAINQEYECCNIPTYQSNAGNQKALPTEFSRKVVRVTHHIIPPNYEVFDNVMALLQQYLRRIIFSGLDLEYNTKLMAVVMRLYRLLIS